MKEKLAQIKAEAIKQIENSRTLEQLNEVRVSQLGKKGALTEILKGMKDVAPEDRPKVGQLVNETRAEIEKVLEDSRKKMEELVREAKMQKETMCLFPVRSTWKMEKQHRRQQCRIVMDTCLRAGIQISVK